MIEYYACSQKGIDQKENEDRIMVDDMVLADGCKTGEIEGDFLALVCDGVGSTMGGERSAEIVSSGFVNYNMEKLSPRKLMASIHQVNASVCEEQKKRPEYFDMACTVAGVVCMKEHFCIFHLGDTRVYKLENGELDLMTKDHTIGNLGRERREWYSCQNDSALTGFIGGPGNACFPTIRRGIIGSKDAFFMICSDGVYKNIPQTVIAEILGTDQRLEEKAECLFERALANGSMDDMSMVLFRYTES